MVAPIRKIFSYKFLPFSWTVFLIILLCLPGSMVPGTGIFGIPNLDKFVHIFLFGTHVILWGWHYSQLAVDLRSLKRLIILDVIITIGLGIALEYVQKYWIPNRSFDVFDILADVVGAVLAGFWLRYRAERKFA